METLGRTSCMNTSFNVCIAWGFYACLDRSLLPVEHSYWMRLVSLVVVDAFFYKPRKKVKRTEVSDGELSYRRSHQELRIPMKYWDSPNDFFRRRKPINKNVDLFMIPMDHGDFSLLVYFNLNDKNIKNKDWRDWETVAAIGDNKKKRRARVPRWA